MSISVKIISLLLLRYFASFLFLLSLSFFSIALKNDDDDVSRPPFTFLSMLTLIEAPGKKRPHFSPLLETFLSSYPDIQLFFILYFYFYFLLYFSPSSASLHVLPKT